MAATVSNPRLAGVHAARWLAALAWSALPALGCAGSGAPQSGDRTAGASEQQGAPDGGGRSQRDDGASAGTGAPDSGTGQSRAGRGGSAAMAAGGGAADGPDSTASDAGGEQALGDGGSDPGGSRRSESPWGVAPSHSSSVGIASWAPAIAESGIDWIRGFDQEHTDSVLPIATANGFHVSGIFDFSDPGGAQTFPVNSIAEFKGYVTERIEQTRGVVQHWEVWNEPPNFSENKSPADYAKVVVAAYEAAKAADPSVQVGLAAQSVNLNFMAQALDAGAAGHFDYVTVHPYETLGLVDDGWEAQFMSIVPTIRKLLADKSPAQRDVPVWFTELGEPVGGAVTPEHQADTLVKAYVMGLAQGAHRIHWFEPLDGDSGPFGLIAGGSGSAPRRPSFTAAATLIAQLGTLPSYVGWTLLHERDYAFVFEGADAPVLIAWAPKGVTDVLDLGQTVQRIDLHTGQSAHVATIELDHSPVLIGGVPEALVAEARAHASEPFPWGGDYSSADSVSYSAADGERGLHPLGSASLADIAGSPARDVSSGPGLSFTVDPNFLAYSPAALRITAVLRRNGSADAGFNLKYESQSGWQGTGSWYTVPGDDQWYTQSWTISDPQFVGKWGYNFAFDSDSTQYSGYSIQSVTVSKE